MKIYYLSDIPNNYSFKMPSLPEICKIMGFDLKRALSLIICNIRDELKNEQEHLNYLLQKQCGGNQFVGHLILRRNNNIESLEKKISFFWRIRNEIKDNSTQEDIKEVFNKNYDISLIKNVPIERVLGIAGMKIERGYFRRTCRDEKTPSTYIYKNKNTWTDFGDSNKSGDVIDLYQEIYKVNLHQALKELNYLI